MRPSFITAGHLAKIGDIGERIGGEQHEVGKFAGFDRAEVLEAARCRSRRSASPATIACDGVMPSSTSPSIAMIVPMP